MTEVLAFEIEGIRLLGVHSEAVCAGRSCILHNPLNHGMRDWKLIWREDRSIFERLCPECGCGHYDSSQYEFHESLNTGWMSVHGCCEHGWGLHQEQKENA